MIREGLLKRGIFQLEKKSLAQKKNLEIEDLETKLGSALLSMVTNKKEQKPIRILLAEDNDDDFFFISEALNKAMSNYQFDWVKNGQEVIEHLESCYNQKQMPDLILLDINMPKLNGHEVLKEMRSDPRFANVLTIVLTSSKAPTDVEQAYENGADSFIIKNSKFEKLVKAIESLSTFWFETSIAPNSLKTIEI